MNETNSAPEGAKRMGVEVLNPVVLPTSTHAHPRAVVDLRVGRFVFRGVGCDLEAGKPPTMQLPWNTSLVSFNNEDDRQAVEKIATEKVTAVLQSLKSASAKGLWDSAN